MQPLTQRVLPVLAIFWFVTAAFAGSVITTGLPTDTAIVNISGAADGAARYDTTQTYWYSPFNSSNQLLQYTVSAGTYLFRIVNPTDAMALYPALSSAEVSQIYTAWSYNSPWVTDYLVFDSSAATNSSVSQLFAGAVTPTADYPGFGSPNAAYNAAKTGGYFNQIVSGVGGRYGGTVSTAYTFSSAETLIFAVPDNLLADNQGGVSVLISPVAPTSTPEPASLLLTAMALVSIPVLRQLRCGRS